MINAIPVIAEKSNCTTFIRRVLYKNKGNDFVSGRIFPFSTYDVVDELKRQFSSLFFANFFLNRLLSTLICIEERLVKTATDREINPPAFIRSSESVFYSCIPCGKNNVNNSLQITYICKIYLSL